MLYKMTNSFHCGSQCIAHATGVYLDGPGVYLDGPGSALFSVALHSDRKIILDARGATVMAAAKTAS